MWLYGIWYGTYRTFFCNFFKLQFSFLIFFVYGLGCETEFKSDGSFLIPPVSCTIGSIGIFHLPFPALVHSHSCQTARIFSHLPLKMKIRYTAVLTLMPFTFFCSATGTRNEPSFQTWSVAGLLSENILSTILYFIPFFDDGNTNHPGHLATSGSGAETRPHWIGKYG